MIAFVIWALVGAAMIGLGIYDFCSKKAVAFGFWANAKVAPVTDVKAYNRALGKLFCIYGVVHILLGLPILAGQDSPYVIFIVLGAMLEAIVAMGIYTVGIEGKYRKK